jgi:hypothetical protein
MRTPLIALTLMLAAACTSTAQQRSSIVVASSPTAETDDTDAVAYEQYVGADGRVVTSQATNDNANANAKPQTTRSRLFDHWTAAYLFTR